MVCHFLLVATSRLRWMYQGQHSVVQAASKFLVLLCETVSFQGRAISVHNGELDAERSNDWFYIPGDPRNAMVRVAAAVQISLRHWIPRYRYFPHADLFGWENRSLTDISETYRETDDQFLLRLLRDTTAAPTRLAYQDFMGYNVTWQAIQQALQKFPKLDRFRFVQLEDTVPAPRVPTSLFASRTTSFPSLTHLQLSFNLARLRYESTAKAVIRLIELCPKLRHIALDPDDYVGHNSLISDNVLGSLANNLASFVLTFRASTPHPLPQKGNGLQLLHLGSKATCSFIDGYFPVLRYAAEQLEVLHLDFDGLMPWPSSSPEIASFPRLRNVFVEQQLPPTLVTMLHASPVVTHLTLRRLKEEDSGYLSKLLSGLLQLRYLVVEGDARLFSTELIGHSLKPLSNLEHLVLEHLAITGALAEILLRLPRLQSLWIHNTNNSKPEALQGLASSVIMRQHSSLGKLQLGDNKYAAWDIQKANLPLWMKCLLLLLPVPEGGICCIPTKRDAYLYN